MAITSVVSSAATRFFKGWKLLDASVLSDLLTGYLVLEVLIQVKRPASGQMMCLYSTSSMPCRRAEIVIIWLFREVSHIIIHHFFFFLAMTLHITVTTIPAICECLRSANH